MNTHSKSTFHSLVVFIPHVNGVQWPLACFPQCIKSDLSGQASEGGVHTSEFE